MVGPFVWMLLGVVQDPAELLQTPPTLLPEHPTPANFTRLFDRLDFPRYFWNSTLHRRRWSRLANLLFCSMAGYALAKLRFAGQQPLFGLVLGDADGAGQRDARAAVRADEQARPRQHATRR